MKLADSLSRVFLIAASIALLSTGCAISHPCLDGGDPARPVPFQGTRQCHQKLDRHGHYVNNGVYREWYPNGQLALEGMYKDGHKDGKWVEWDSSGRKISEKYFDNGVEGDQRSGK